MRLDTDFALVGAGLDSQAFGPRGPAPGKVSLTQRLPPRRHATATAARANPPGAAPAVQADRGAMLDDDPFALHLVAERGARDGGSALPHLDQLQAAFGHHDLSGVRAHVGGAAATSAAAIGATAYATGDDVAFAATPDLRQAAHEAAHVVQQRGGVRLDGGVGRAGDPYERHADAVADLVLRGESAEALLDTMAHRGATGGPAVQRLEDEDINGNVLSLTSTDRSGHLDERSRRRVWERLAQLDPAVDAAAWDTMTPDARERELGAAIVRFQNSDRGRAMIEEIERANETPDPDGSGRLYDEPSTGETDRSPWRTARAELTEGDLLANDVTAQALANVWPQMIFGRMMTEEQAFIALIAIVRSRSLPFDLTTVNVIGVRGYQGGEVHDNDTERIFTSRNTYNDTQFIVWKSHERHNVRQSRATVDPGHSSRAMFAVEGDQQWDYSGTPDDRSYKFDRAMYGLAARSEVRRGRHWDEHPEDVELAAAITHGSGRIIRVPSGALETDLDIRGDARVVSAIHSGGDGGGHGATTFGDSTGCSVVHGAWFAHFNESLRRADGELGHGDDANVRFTYSLIDPSQFAPGELDRVLDPIVPRAETASAEEAEGAAPAVAPDRGQVADAPASRIHALASAGVTGPSRSLPHLADIQASFGHHDVTAVQAHVGGAATAATTAMGAQAYAYGDHVAFTAAPDLRQAAHEAAHVVQQRDGVRLDGGVGRAGDPYERHADAVAALVVRGESAEGLLDTMAHRGGAGDPAVQRIDFDGDHVDDGPARTPAALTRLVERTLEAIAMNEIGGGDAIESRMGTSAGVAASFASATQMIAGHARGLLARHRGVAARYGLDRVELNDANAIELAATRVWDAIVLHGASPARVARGDLELTHFTAEELDRMVHFRHVRAALRATARRFARTDDAHALARTIAGELADDEHVVACGLDESDLVAFLHDGQLNRFSEDRAAWTRLAMTRTTERHAEDGAPARTLEDALESAAEDDGGWALSRIDFDDFIRDYVAAHPEATDQQVVRAAAGHNGHSSAYPDRIWRNYQRVLAGGGRGHRRDAAGGDAATVPEAGGDGAGAGAEDSAIVGDAEPAGPGDDASLDDASLDDASLDGAPPE